MVRIPKADQAGSAVLGIFMLSLVLSIALSQLYLQVESIRNSVQREHAAINADNVMVLMQMALSNPAVCRANLTPAGFGTTFAEMQALGAASNHGTFLPAMTVGGPPLQLRVGSRIMKSTISQIGFLAPVQLVSIQNGYLTDLEIRLRSLDLRVERAFRIPILLETDAGGNFTSCKATSKSPSGPRLMVIDNDLCAKFNWDSSYIYFYAGRFCAPVSILPSPPTWFTATGSP